MTATITTHDAARLADLHAELAVFLATGSPRSVTSDIKRTARDYFALTARLGVSLHNEGFEEYVQHFIGRYFERQREVWSAHWSSRKAALRKAKAA